MNTTTLDQLKAKLFACSDKLRTFPLQHNGLVFEAVRNTKDYKQALEAYKCAKAELLNFKRETGA